MHQKEAIKAAIRAILVNLRDQQADVVGFKTVMRDDRYILIEGHKNKKMTLDKAVTTLALQARASLQEDARLRLLA